MEIAEFLLARIAEDEAVARAAIGKRVDISAIWSDMEVSLHIDRWSSARVIAECEAKRQIVEAHPLTSDVVPVHTGPQPDVGCETCHTVTAASVMDPDYVEALGPCDTMLALALPYADHPDYDPAWAPTVSV